ncbi:hypothetical protein G3G77_004901 [Salmonella enterica]|nr:hypothetical protein [Salmonella enterica]EEG5674797.1 hypothetical protein [Salmonella enterica]EEH5466598.1 hypothetical protein [Salmonella enterica]EEH7556138.1 hypothetical protein [Salmonella enterica]EEO5640388.1 hypothetical protein [Salmonella enterica]
MAKIQARNIDDALFARIEQAAMRNERSLEGEVRFALAAYYVPQVDHGPVLSKREHWQIETGERLRWLFERLLSDGYFDTWNKKRSVDTADWVKIARQLEVSPGLLMDIIEGRQEITFSLADAIAKHFNSSCEWLLSGEGMPFPVLNIGHSYHKFLLPDTDDGQNVFEFIRVEGGLHNGTLLILRKNIKTSALSMGVVTSGFLLAEGMGSGGHGYLKSFLLFLKTKCHQLPINTYDFAPVDADFDFWSVIGQHHPVWFQDANRRSAASWLQQMFIGDDPADWFEGWSQDLKEIADTPFGGAKPDDEQL